MENPTRDPIADESRELIDKLLQERLTLAGIAPVTGVCEPWLQMYLHQKYYQTPRQEVLSNSSAGGSFSKKRGKLTIPVDEMWSLLLPNKRDRAVGQHSGLA